MATLACISCAFAVLACCMTYYPSIRGRAEDMQSGAPIAGVAVTATWAGRAGLEGHQYCAHAEVAVTAADGSFEIPRRVAFASRAGAEGDFILGAYQEGRELRAIKHGGVIRLGVIEEPREQRFGRLFHDVISSWLWTCGHLDGTSRLLYPIHMRQLAELESLAATDRQRELLTVLRDQIPQDLVDFSKPVKLIHIDGGRAVSRNVNPADSFLADRK